MIAPPRPKSLVFIILAALTTYLLVFTGPSTRLRIVPYNKVQSEQHSSPPVRVGEQQNEKSLDITEDVTLKNDPGHHHEETTGTRAGWEIDIDDLTYWSDPDDTETEDDVLPGYETDGTPREPGDVYRLQHEKDLRKMWRYAYKTTAK